MSDPAAAPAKRKGIRTNSIFVKLAVAITLTSVLLCVALAVEYTRATYSALDKQLSRAATDMTGIVADNVSGALRFGRLSEVQATVQALTGHDNAEAVFGVTLRDDGSIFTEDGVDASHKDALVDLAQKAMQSGAPVVSDDGLMTASPTILPDVGITSGAVAFAWSADSARAAVAAEQGRTIAIAVAIFAIGLAALLWFINHAVVSPVKFLTRGVHLVADEDYDMEFQSARRGDEIGDIAKAVDTLRQKLMAGAEEARQNRFRGVAFEGSAAAIMMADADMNITEVNPALVAVLGEHADEFRQQYPSFDLDDVVGTEMDFFHVPAIRERIRALLLDPANLPHKANISVGESRFSLLINMVRCADGNRLGYVVEWNDETQAFMNDAILSTIDANQVKAEFDLKGKYLRSNALFLSMVGAEAEELKGRAGADLFSFDAKMAADRGAVFDRLSRGDSVYGRFDLPTSDGKTAIVEGGFAPVKDGRGNILRFILIGTDATDARRAIEAADARRAEMEAAQATVVDGLRVGLEALAGGDLTAVLQEEFTPDYEQLRLDFNQAAERLREAMHGVVENADLIRGEASEISNSADDLSSRTERQAATLEQTASALDQLTSSVSSAADGATHANEIVETARRNAEASGEVVREAVGAMSEIESSSQQISKITGVIDDIAFQTNLLALNAGVEAARAGEAGRGFAVVASEVRALAQRSSEAAREINELINASGGQVKRGVDLVGQAGEALQKIVESVSEISQKVNEIAVSSREQSSGLGEINEAVNQLDQVTQQNAAMFEETTAASHALTSEAEALTQTMARFDLGVATRPAPDAAEKVVSAQTFASRRAVKTPEPQAVSDPAVPVVGSSAPAAPVVEGAAAVAADLDTEIEEDWDDF